jgi:hypothetical protein
MKKDNIPPENWKASFGVNWQDPVKQLIIQIRHYVSIYESPESIIKAISDLTNSKAWQDLAWQEATKMVKRLDVSNAKTWREAATKSRKGYEIHHLL